jgi:hypothetical protein
VWSERGVVSIGSQAWTQGGDVVFQTRRLK